MKIEADDIVVIVEINNMIKAFLLRLTFADEKVDSPITLY
jgi:hypothetical protein